MHIQKHNAQEKKLFYDDKFSFRICKACLSWCKLTKKSRTLVLQSQYKTLSLVLLQYMILKLLTFLEMAVILHVLPHYVLM